MHAPLPPSSAARLIACPGSRHLEALHADVGEKADAAEGEASHWAASELLKGSAVAVGQIAPNGIILNVEMIEHAETYANHIKARGPVGQVEQLVASAALHVENYGTPDHVYYDGAGYTLYVDDYKYGHKYVDHIGNWQCLDYAALKLHEMGLMGYDEIDIVITIIQPRAYHRLGPIREWRLTVGEARPYWFKLSEAFSHAMRDDAPVIAADPDACDDCKGRFDCEAVTHAAHWGAGRSHSRLPLQMSPQAMSRELRELRRAKKFMEAKIEGVEEWIKHRIKSGNAVPYFGLAHKPGREVFVEDARENGLVDAARALNLNIEKSELITPKQAIKLGMPEALVKSYSRTNNGAVELIEDDGTAAANIFGN